MIQQVNVNKTHHRILILGGGTAAHIMTASLLRRAGQADIAILTHFKALLSPILDRGFYFFSLLDLHHIVNAQSGLTKSVAITPRVCNRRGTHWVHNNLA